MDDAIELLSIDLLEDTNTLKELDHWLAVFNWINGWHYDLDIIWTIKQLKINNILPGSTILDAGAGYGMTQFILASRGYNIISLDFTTRTFPKEASGIFDIEIIDSDLGDYKSEYMEYMTYGKSTNEFAHFLESAPKALLHPVKVVRYLNRVYRKFQSAMVNRSEKNQKHEGYGKIKFLRGTFNNIPLENKSVDALISVSAFEHNKYADMPDSVNEFNRILKDGGMMFITTSAARSKDWYQEASKGWCFTKGSLSSWFNIPEENNPFDYNTEYEKIRNSNLLASRLADYYKSETNMTVPQGDLKNIEYIPIGIRKNKYYETD